MSLLTRDAILSVDDTTYAIVPVPEWGGDVRVRSLSGADRATIIANYNDGEDAGKFDLYILALCLVDENGNRMFTVKDVDALAKKSSIALIRVTEEAKRISGLSVTAESTAEKN
jgi:hypothetical protein